MTNATATSTTRRYDSELRRKRSARTRADVLGEAHRLFLERGWTATGVRDIAAAAKVSVKTIYDTFGSKAALFKVVVDVAVAGDDEPVEVMERDEFAALARGDLDQRVAAGVRLTAGVNRRAADLLHVWRTAADTDPDLAVGLAVALRQQRDTTVAALALLAGRVLEEQEAEGLWAVVSDQVYRLLVRDAGWPEERYEAWLTGLLIRQLRPIDPSSGGTIQERQQE